MAANLLPRSGIGVDGPNLVIAPPGNPVIRLDSRLLDRVELVGRSPTSSFVLAGAAAGGAVAGALSVIPGGIFVCAGMLYLAHEQFSEGRHRRRSRDLLLALGKLEVVLHVADGSAAAKHICDHLHPYTREAPISRPEVYQDAKRRLQAQMSGHSAAAKREADRGLRVGDDEVQVSEGMLRVGSVTFRVEDVREYALRGANLPLPGGRLLQAAMGLLVVEAEARAERGEDLEALSRRIAEYEKWTGRNAGR